MLAFEGDTGPYLQYAHARIRSIFRRGPGGAACAGRGPAPRRAPGAGAGAAAAGLRGGGRGDGRDLQPVEAVHLPLRPGHHVHRLLRGLPGAGRRRGAPHLAPRACATSRPGCSNWGCRCSASRRPSRCDRARGGPYPLPGTTGPRTPTTRTQGDDMDLNGTSAIVTGGASGLGRGHLAAAGRARRPRRGGRPAGGQGRAPGQGDRRAVRPDRRHQHRAGHRRGRGRHRDGAAQVTGQLRRHRLGHPHHRQGRRLRLGPRPRPVPPGDRDQPRRHLQLHPPGRHQDEPATSPTRTAPAAPSSTRRRWRPRTARSGRPPTRRRRAASSA